MVDFPELKARIDAAKASFLAERIDALKVALAGMPSHFEQYQWVADKKQAFGEKRVRFDIVGDNGKGMGRQWIATVPGDWIATVPGDNCFRTLADFIAAANPDTIRMLLDRIQGLEATLEVVKQFADASRLDPQANFPAISAYAEKGLAGTDYPDPNYQGEVA